MNKRIKFLFLMFGINGPPYMQHWVRQTKMILCIMNPDTKGLWLLCLYLLTFDKNKQTKKNPHKGKMGTGNKHINESGRQSVKSTVP